ncbi:MAG: succinylglutamate desuccinylase/aspartoacylase family protein [Bacteroidota bacterium]
MDNKFILNKNRIEPGQNENVQLHVARLPSGTVINLRFHVFRSKNPGPTLLVMGGVHGDEINGVEIVRRMVSRGLFKNLERGSVIAIPLLNVYGFINFSRDTLDGKDVNRSFPGSMKGSLASRVAAALTKNILPLVDVGLDFHTGGGARYNYPQVRYTAKHPQSIELAKAFAAPYLVQKPAISKSLRKIMISQNKPHLVFEGGESLRYDGFSIDNGVAGTLRLMKHLEMIKDAPELTRKTIVFEKSNWVRADRSGLFRWTQESGAKVSKGEPLGFINDPYGEKKITVRANQDGYIIGHNNAPVVSAGDALFHIGRV